MFLLSTTLIRLSEDLEQTATGSFLEGLLRAIITFSVVAFAIFVCLRGARRLKLISPDILDILGPLLPFSLLVASISWSFFATIESVLVESSLPPWVVVRFMAIMLMVGVSP